ncbi:DedA family protein [Fonticella tunisiensis]|uniref:Membrane protein DedA with SNARE-associated domain n=1 Tax=Fonticella tunisiensis TaxID=1096341 RepID=A0A4R7KVG6_9CLOT|nr:DedA family protein [Fonticella tunisiensis]TDT63622.1 membrane protein DedA with SNARE-associated domain [Fonticella tunisiensis]
MSFLAELFNHYGYIVLFAALKLELIAFPTPGEALMTYCGFLVFQGRLNWGISIIAAALGVISGISISYFIGHILGTSFFKKYGSYIHMGPDKLNKTSRWFERYGNGLLVTAYFIPGIRHITGYFSGITKMPFKRFALNAYVGAFIWTGTFISLGRILGSNWEIFHGYIRRYMIIGGIVLAVGLMCIYLCKNYKAQITEFIIKSLENSIKIFHSLGKIKVAIVEVAVVFVGLSIIVVGLIQDFLANEFSQFDTIVTYLVSLILSENWFSFMKLFEFSTAPEVLIVLMLLTLTWIMLRGRNRFLETRFLIITVLGGELL